MKKARRIKKSGKSFWYYVSVLLILFSLSAIVSFLYLKPKVAFKSQFIEDIESKRRKAEAEAEGKNSSRLYTTQPPNLSENNFELKRENLLIVAEDVIRKYMQPYGVKLLDLYMDASGIIYADFSSELRRNFNMDASNEYKMIAGLYKSIKEKIPEFKSLKILIAGEEAESFGGHIDISKPIGEEIERLTDEKIEGTI